MKGGRNFAPGGRLKAAMARVLEASGGLEVLQGRKVMVSNIDWGLEGGGEECAECAV